MSKGLTSRAEDYSQWYNELVRKGELAEHSDVRGCMVIKPYGFALWENMKAELDRMFKETGHMNAYFPLFIPKSYLSKEADHVDGFAKECAVVTHYRLKNAEDGSGVVVAPEAKLEEELIIRPTSETIIWSTFKKWIQSYRDLPLLINQWANVVRWEMRTRLFLRTAEFLWQEGHTAHATEKEAIEEAETMLEVYATFVEQFLAIPVIRGLKTPSERFAGAVETYCIEALMQDGKALQAGTSHFLGQNFAKAFDVKFTDKDNQEHLVWATSWGVSTRLVGALIMAHSDDEGLQLPPRVAPIQAVILPFLKKNKEEHNTEMIAKARELEQELKAKGIRTKVDTDETKRPGFKYAEYELKGVPLRIAVGPRDLENNQAEVARRDTKEKFAVSLDNFGTEIESLLEKIQDNMYNRAKEYQQSHISEANTWEDFVDLLDNKGGFVSAHWDGTEETEDLIKEETKATIRCIPLTQSEEEGVCIKTGKPSSKRVLFAKAY